MAWMQAREVAAVWRQDYNEVRPHGTIGRIPPAEFTAKHSTTTQGSMRRR
jgi:putative transposase